MDAGFLRCGDEEVALRPKSFEVLAYLVEHDSRVVKPDGAFVLSTLAS